MGLTSFLTWLWSPGSQSLPATQLPPAPTHTFRPVAFRDHRKSLSFALDIQVYTWLESMAVAHNYGSVHKSVRDILLWASHAHGDDRRWLFDTKHHVPPCLDFKVETCEHRTVIAGSRCARSNPIVFVDARLSDSLNRWIAECVEEFGLAGPSVVLETVCRCAIVLEADDDIFCSHESSATTADLYHDLGIIRSPRTVMGDITTG